MLDSYKALRIILSVIYIAAWWESGIEQCMSGSEWEQWNSGTCS